MNLATFSKPLTVLKFNACLRAGILVRVSSIQAKGSLLRLRGGSVSAWEVMLGVEARQLSVRGLCLLPPSALRQYPHPLGASVIRACKEHGISSPQGHDGWRMHPEVLPKSVWVPGRACLRPQI